MSMKIGKHLTIFAALSLLSCMVVRGADRLPYLKKQGTAMQLIVDGKPFLVIGGELRNSSTGSLEYMKPLWNQMAALNLNTVLPVISWELIEPEEGNYDFTLVDAMIEGARAQGLRLIPLWFGTWKNGMSSYVPLWVKEDYKRFPRMKVQNSESVEIISTFSREALEADARAFAALMRHIREVDGKHHTVIMMQVENEVGVLGDSRDRSEAAIKAFNQSVPQELMDYMNKNKESLIPEMKTLWETAGYPSSGSWAEVFGPGMWTDNVFMAWQYAGYIDKVTAAGKAEYPLPMYVNAWLELPGMMKPGRFPSGGPLPRVMDVWKAGAPHIDFISPDIYAENFEDWCDWYTQLDNPLFIPEVGRSAESAANLLFAFGNYSTIGTSPFAIDDLDPAEDGPIEKLYLAMQYLGPEILKHQGRENTMTGFLLDDSRRSIDVQMGDYNVVIELFSHRGKILVDDAFGLIIKTGDREFLIAGSRALISFKSLLSPQDKYGIGKVQEIVFVNGQWRHGRRLNGDETHRGRAARLPMDEIGIQHVTVYHYK